jgi:hypothetical protein
LNWFDRFLLGYVGVVAAVLLAPAYLILFLTIGRRLRTLLRLPLAPSLRPSGDLIAGAWAWSTAALTLGLAGRFTNGALLLLLLVAAIACFIPWRRDKRSSLPPVGDLLAVGAPALVLAPIALGPPFFYDALVYHLGLPWQMLKDGAIVAHPEDLFSTFPPLAQLIYAQPIALGSDQVPALLHFGSFLAAGLAVCALARRLGAGSWRARLAGATVPLLPAVVLVPALPAAEGWLLAAVVTSVALAVGPEARHARLARFATPLFAGFLAGAAVSARLQGIAWSAIVAALLLPRVVRTGGRTGWGRLWQVGLAVLGWGTGSALWRLKNLLLLGDPIAPLGWRREGIETLFRDSGALMHAAADAGSFVAALGPALRPHLGYLLPLGLAALLAVVGRDAGGAAAHDAGRGTLEARTARANRRLILLAALLGFAAWAATGTLPRFLAPTLCLLLALTAAVAGNRFSTSAATVAGGIVFLLGFAFTVRDPVLRRSTRVFFHAPTLQSTPFIVDNPMVTFTAADMLPRDSLTLFVAEARGYRFPRRALIPSQHDPSPLRAIIETNSDPRAVAAALRARGISHLLINRDEMRRLAGSYPVLPWSTPEGQARFQALLELCGAPVVRGGETAVFALPAPAGDAAAGAALGGAAGR